MKRTLILLLLLLGGALVLGCDSNSLTIDNEPMDGTFETTFDMMTLEVDPDSGLPTRADVVVYGSGQVNLFGNVGVVITIVDIDLTAAQATATTMMVMTDSDGDKIMCRGMTVQTPPDEAGRFTFTSADTITEGTGKFVHVKGTGGTVGEGNILTSAGSFTLSGTVSY